MITASRTSRCAAVALAGVTAISLAACGSSTSPSASSSNASPTSSSTATPGAAPSGGHGGKDRDRAVGLVASVNGGTVTLNGRDGTATVDVTPSTHVIQLAQGQLSDVAAGECLVARPTKDGGQPPNVTAAAVVFGASNDGRCGHGGRQGRGVVGTVASVNGSSIVVNGADDAGQYSVTVTPQTRYEKRTPADASAITAGSCLAAHGTKDANGTLQAASASVRPARDGRCGPDR